jgi:hypothetical protein
MGIQDINKIPRMQNVNATALANAAPRGMLKSTRVDTTNFEAAVNSCKGKTDYAAIKASNIAAGVSSTDTRCGWVRFEQGQLGGEAVLGTHFGTIGPMPEGATASSRYYPPLLTTSAKSPSENWSSAIPCRSVDGRIVCGSNREQFTNPIVSTKYASVNDEFATPFLYQVPMASATPISRDKFIQADANVGTMVATLYQESERGKQDIGLQTNASYSIFKKSMTNTSGTDTASWESAFATNRPVGNDIYPRPSRDIAVSYGNLEKHDFCAEMNEQTIINEDTLPCLQRDWLSKGGLATDYNYPNTGLYGTCYGRVRK